MSVKIEEEERPNENVDDASCWVCLEEGTPTAPLVRDCSCRGADAGFAHFGCLVEFAGKKTAATSAADGGWAYPWQNCSICHHSYANELRLNMANAFVKWTADNIKREEDPYRHAEALYIKLLAIDDMPEESNKVANEICTIIVGIGEIDHHAANLMSLAYEKLGWNAMRKITNNNTEEERNYYGKEAIKNLEAYRDLAKAIGHTVHFNDAESRIAVVKAQVEKGSSMKGKISFLRAQYAADPSERNASNLLFALRLEGHGIEHERLMESQVVTLRRVRGPNHPDTQDAELTLRRLQTRMVTLIGEDKDLCYNVIGYEENGEKIVLKGPMAGMWDFDGGETHVVDAGKVRIQLGTPVVCHGLKNAGHLNGKMGDARAFDEDTGRYEVHFEDASLKPRSARIKQVNLRIALKLPSK